MILPPGSADGSSLNEGWDAPGAPAAAEGGTATAVAGARGFAPEMSLCLPNGMVVIPQSRVEAEHFYEDIFEKRIYLRHGVTLQSGDCVFDVGGNIGMFALFAHRHAPGARIHTFEPAPPLFHRLRTNLALNGVAARAFNVGIADGERSARFTFYPNSSGMSSFYADAEEERAVLRVMMRRQRQHGVPEMDTLLEYGDELLDERFRAVEMECRLRPLSAVIREEGVERIDLLKVDVQKAELDVLRGIEDRDWPRIRQVVMEVHDLGGRVDEVSGLLRARGFRVAVEQDEAVEGSILFNLFAVRPAPPPRVSEAGRQEEGAPRALDGAPRQGPWHLLLLSASSPQALDAAARELAAHLATHPELPLADVGHALRERPPLRHRRAVLVGEGEDAPALLLARDPTRTADGVADEPAAAPVFLFPGVGEQYPGMARALYAAEPTFRAGIDRCAAILGGHLGFDLRDALFAADDEAAAPSAGFDLRRMLGRAPVSAAAARLNRTEVAQPVAFAVGYALARLWEAWGVRPAAVIGHSLGEYTAACVAGVFSLDDALELVALRARAIQALPAGAMLAVSLSSNAVRPWLGDGVALAAVNAPELCVLSGSDEAIGRAERELLRAGHAARRLAATHAFHSPLMEPVAGRMSALAARTPLSAPRIPLVSNVTGRWMTADEAGDPGYWARHLVGTVHFSRGAAELLAVPGCVLVELGPGGSLGAFVRQQAAAEGAAVPAGVSSLPHAAEGTPEPAFFLGALGRLWTAGVQPDWSAFRREAPGVHVVLPGPADDNRAESTGANGAGRAKSVTSDVASGSVDEDGSRPVAQALAAVWHELLGVAPGADDDFFLLGGHSLVAARLIARVREEFGVEMRLRTLFQTRTLSGMARWIEEAAAGREVARR